MRLLDTAFAFVHQAFGSRDSKPGAKPSPAILPSSARPAPNDDPLAVALFHTREAVVIADDEPDAVAAAARRAAPVALVAEPPSEAATGEVDEFADLLSGLGVEHTPTEAVSDLDRKQREVDELQRNLEMLRPIGDELARVERQRIAERAEFETRMSELRSQLEAATASHTAPEAPRRSAVRPSREALPELKNVTRLLSALDTTLTSALTGAEHSHGTRTTSSREDSEVSPATLDSEATSQDAGATATESDQLARAREQLAGARKRLEEQKRKTAAGREQLRELRGRLKQAEGECKLHEAGRKKVRTQVRELLRRAKQPTKPLLRLAELLELEHE